MNDKETIKKSKYKNKDEILLLKKGKRGIVKILFGRTGIVLILLLIQIVLWFSIFLFLTDFIQLAFGTLFIISLLMIIYVINKNHDATVKITWVILIALLPAFGSLFYIYIQSNIGNRQMRNRVEKIIESSKDYFPKHKQLMEQVRIQNKGLYNLAIYTGKAGGFPVYENSSIKYFSLGEKAFEEMLIQIEKAENYIFLEYFVVDEGHMWGRILKLLSEKVQQGVEVRMMYDGTCELAILPYNYPEELSKMGILCHVFSPIQAFISSHFNYRDHRKILVIDGRVAFTGGINLADEYINQINIYGHWKDVAIMISGEAVASFEVMFLQMWYLTEKKDSFEPFITGTIRSEETMKGYVLPFGDNPLDNDKVGEMIYMDILNRATDYVYVTTPYLIPDGELMTAFQFAAKRGIDVKLILPHIPDKKLIFAQTRSYYKELIKAGVEIYEYTPGFCHAKVFVSDNKKAVVGTINLDYRSLYHHFECGVYMEDVATVKDIVEDIQETLLKCQRISLEDIHKHSLVTKILGSVLKLLAPLM